LDIQTPGRLYVPEDVVLQTTDTPKANLNTDTFFAEFKINQDTTITLPQGCTERVISAPNERNKAEFEPYLTPISDMANVYLAMELGFHCPQGNAQLDKNIEVRVFSRALLGQKEMYVYASYNGIDREKVGLFQVNNGVITNIILNHFSYLSF
jgi:hypothetical protein